MIRIAKSVGERMVIDGCPIGCAWKIMDANLIQIDRYVIVTEPGIDKTHELDIDNSDIITFMQEVKGSLERYPSWWEKLVKGGWFMMLLIPLTNKSPPSKTGIHQYGSYYAGESWVTKEPKDLGFFNEEHEVATCSIRTESQGYRVIR